MGRHTAYVFVDSIPTVIVAGSVRYIFSYEQVDRWWVLRMTRRSEPSEAVDLGASLRSPDDLKRQLLKDGFEPEVGSPAERIMRWLVRHQYAATLIVRRKG